MVALQSAGLTKEFLDILRNPESDDV